MLLYEKFGDNYDKIVSEMNFAQKKKLKAELESQTPKDLNELIGSSPAKASEIEDVQIEVEPPTPSPRTVYTPTKKSQQEAEDGEKFSPRSLADSTGRMAELRADLALALSPDASLHDEDDDDCENDIGFLNRSDEVQRNDYNDILREEEKKLEMKAKKSVTSSGLPVAVKPKQHATPSVPTKTTSKFRTPSSTMCLSSTKTKTDSAFKTPRTPTSGLRLTGTSSTGGRRNNTAKPPPSYLRPTSASKHRASPRKDPISNETLDISMCPRHGHCGGDDFHHQLRHQLERKEDRTPRKHRTPTGAVIDFAKIVSPVGEYIRHNPAPPLIRYDFKSKT